MKREPLIHRLILDHFDVEMRLPRDLTKTEADRICALIKVLAVDEDEQPEATR